jgi:predicted membrane protein
MSKQASFKDFSKNIEKYQIIKSKAIFDDDENKVDAYYVKKNNKFIFKYGEFFSIFFKFMSLIGIMLAVVSLVSLFFDKSYYFPTLTTLQSISAIFVIYASVYDDAFKVGFRTQGEAEKYISDKTTKEEDSEVRASNGEVVKEILINKN